jgi:hypothetical protein
MVVVRKAIVILVTGSLGYSGAAFGQQALSEGGDPPSRVGRLAFAQGTVSFHDSERTDWQPAVVNMPLTTGDAVWTEPKAHSELSIAGTRVRLDGATQLDVLTLDDQSTRLQLDQGRVDIKTFNYDAKQPYDLVTPRGIATLQQQGDYYVEAGSTQDPTRLGVRTGAAQFQAPDGRVLAVRAGEVAEITGDGSAMELHTIQSPPPPMPQYWAARDKQVVYDRPPQYLSASVTGYEDLNYYGTWQNDPEYGQVWYVRNAPSGWAPYTTGRWVYEPVYGWTWVDEQPWGFAPYHYGRWAQRNNRWFWVPPERSRPAVYAPALVAFVGGTELGVALGVQSRRPVGWFPLGPREVYVPPYTSNRDYYRRLNLANRVQDRMLEERWERAQRHEAVVQNHNWMNRRFARIVPAETFVHSQPVQRSFLRVSADKVAAAPVAAIAAPPQPTQSIRALLSAPADKQTPNTAQRPNTQNAPNAAPSAQADAHARAGARAHFAGLQALKPEPKAQAQKAPGPEIVSRSAVTTKTDGKPSTDTKASGDAKAALPKLEPRNASAAPPPKIEGERKPATTQPGSQQATAPANQPNAAAKPGEPSKPGEPPKPAQPQANAPAKPEPTKPGEPAKPGQPNAQPNQANLPPVRDRNEHRPEPPKPGQPQANTAPNAQTPKSGETPKPQNQAAPQAKKPGEAPKPPQASNTAQPAKPGEAAKPQSAPAQHQATPQQHRAEPPKPPQASNTPQRQAEPPKPPQQSQHQQQRQPAASPPSQTHAAPQPQHQPAPQPQRQAAPPPQQHAPQPQRQAAPQQQHAPQSQPQRQASPPQQQHAPPPQQHQQAAPRPQQHAPQQAQTPHPQPQQHQQQAKPQQPPQQGGGQHKQDDKK